MSAWLAPMLGWWQVETTLSFGILLAQAGITAWLLCRQYERNQ